MDELIKLVSDKAGITADQARSAIEAVGAYAKDKLPPGIGEQVGNFLAGKDMSGLAAMAESLKDKFGL